ncbi:MAG TPA: DUF6036 family nucleotidyltransferase [Candidatus Nanoarchaeia archaeon]|nr:DUF6036 family nucleotidyltransferase [Candidatus Nanoarchaeia archaeon]
MITRHDLLDWLKSVDSKLSQKMMIVAVGGTALTLLGLKESTRDVDFCISKEYFAEFKKAAVSERFVVDLFQEGYIFAVQLPKDYTEKAETVHFSGKRLLLKTLSVEDIILTKTARFNNRDIEDIKAVVASRKVELKDLRKRFLQILETYAGREEDYTYHFDLVMKIFFGEK